MSGYFRDTPEPAQLLADERAPLTGRRVPRGRSKHHQHASQVARPRPRWPMVAAGTVGVVASVSVVLVVRNNNDDNVRRVTEAPTTIGAAQVPAPIVTAPVRTTVPVTTVLATTLPVTTAPATTVPATVAATTVPASSAPATVPPTDTATATTLAGPVIQFGSPIQATAATVKSTDPNVPSRFDGALPVFSIVISCTGPTTCSLSFASFTGPTPLTSTDGHFTFSSEEDDPCTGSKGTHYTQHSTGSLDLTVSGTQVIDGVTVPTAVAGTVILSFDDAGYVPKVGQVVDPNAETGCSGETTTFTVSSPLAPG